MTTDISEQDLTTLLTSWAEISKIHCQALTDAKAELAETARLARQRGWSAQRIATLVGVSKRTIQVWTDHEMPATKGVAG
jgi:hypothetical protein